ncbi:MAG: sugar transferase, partial [Porphyromonadaceae bacterium]|nr:sugar transferase [Porphyromonadaceae bacterium]
MNTFERVIKRAFDFTLALVSLIFFSPLIALIALLIKWEDSKGDVIYRQERIGYKGKPFTLYKFRSMRMDAEAGNRPQLFTDGDSRLTKVGAFIRAHHLDEFPQLWNVIKGEMSFVGPRPE